MAEKPKVKPKVKSKPSKSKSIAGKGDNPRNCFSEDYRDNYDNINWSDEKNN